MPSSYRPRENPVWNPVFLSGFLSKSKNSWIPCVSNMPSLWRKSSSSSSKGNRISRFVADLQTPDGFFEQELLELGDRIGYVSTGLLEEEIRRCIGKIKFSASDNLSPSLSYVNRKCSICQEEYETEDEMGRLSYGHVYHTQCIKQWLSLNASSCINQCIKLNMYRVCECWLGLGLQLPCVFESDDVGCPAVGIEEIKEARIDEAMQIIVARIMLNRCCC
ncbi:hypothetical protein Droror1_Dr00021443 [Drosera rotundifolia]